jgi:predicted RecB family nuclease
MAATRDRRWVSKTDVTRYIRCPYTWYLLDRGELDFADMVDESQQQLIVDGQAFHLAVESDLVTRSVAPAALGPAVEERGDGTGPAEFWVSTAILENPKRRLYGLPDAIDPAGGALWPIEFKSHKRPSRTDELELAFYWWLLDPWRTMRRAEPRGRLVLRQPGGLVEVVDIAIPPHRFDQLKEYLQAIRRGRLYPVRPRICNCRACRTLLRSEVLAATRQDHDLTLINGIARARADHLATAGIETWDDLLAADPRMIQRRLAARRDRIGIDEVLRWRYHALSYRDDRPVTFGEPPTLGPKFIALDLEYEIIGRRIWLIGVGIVDGDFVDHRVIWAEYADEERQALMDVADLVARHPETKIVTWAGITADMPALRAAAHRHGLQEALAPVFDRHLDLYAHADRTVRFPIPDLRLKDVSSYLELERASVVTDGFDAVQLYGRMGWEPDPARRAVLHARLTDYCTEDVDGLVEIARRFEQGFSEAEPPETTGCSPAAPGGPSDRSSAGPRTYRQSPKQ